MTGLWVSGLFAYSAQLAALVGVAWLAGWILRIRAPRQALWLWNAVLLGSIVLPIAFVSPQQQPVELATLAQAVGMPSTIVPLMTSTTSGATILLAIAGAGALFKLLRLTLGLTRLGVIRRRSQPMRPAPACAAALSARLNAAASIHVSGDVDCPVTLGFWKPLVLLPHEVLTMPESWKRAIICHEMLHVRRRDGLRILVEQIWSAALWFHPAAYVVLARLALMREAVVDADTIALTGDRRAYAQALLAFAEPTRLVPHPAMPLIMPRHLPRRIALIAQEVRMSRSHSIVGLASALLLVTVATGAMARRLPLPIGSPAANSTVAAQEPVRPGDGVTLPRVIKGPKPEYTGAALQARIEGTVHIETVVLPSGEPSRMRITQSLDQQYGLDQEALNALSQWRFEPGRRNGKPVPVIVTVEMTFTLK